MNRQIKFRAWEIKRSIMWPIAHIGMNTVVCAKILGKQSLITQNKIEEFQLMQLTGLLDNKGVEIYEGDILRVITHGDWLDECEYMHNVEVKFEQKEFGECDGCGWIYIPKKREVIGNIFETPELLKK